MSLLSRLFAARRDGDPAPRLADAVIHAARRPGFYLTGLAEDTFDGRFGMVALHGALVMRRLKSFGNEGLAVSERLGEALFDRFDYAYREEGVGDSAIARKVRQLGERYFGLARALDGALDGGEPVAASLQRNGLGGLSPERLADWVAEADRRIAGIAFDDVRAARIPWPDPPSA